MNGPSAGLPRVYDIALETISHGDGRVDPESLSSFVASYQTVTVLKLGELWAIPIMLRLALIENLRRIPPESPSTESNRNLADYWADRMVKIAERGPEQSDPGDRRHGPVKPADGQLVCRRADPPPAGPGPGAGPAAYLDGTAPVRVRSDH